MSSESAIDRPKDSEREWLKVWSLLDEAPARLMAAQRALELGRGGVCHVSQLTGYSRTTIARGISDLRDRKALARVRAGRNRRFGGGRKRIDAVNPGLIKALKAILEETTMGDPVSALKWTNKSTRTLAEELTQQGYPVSRGTVGRLLVGLEYSLQANVRVLEGDQHVDRDAQFRYINAIVKEHLDAGEPVISVDGKKRELVGRFKNGGRTLRPKGEPEKVNVYDYRSDADGIAIPYGTFDVRQNQALVNVGTTADTSEFAVESIRRWWKLMGKPAYPNATRLLVCADGGGSNGSRRRTWKWQLQQLATELAVSITVCHYPPGTSKWNKIEHRLFSQISLNWRGKPLVDYQTVINLIGGTRTRTGLRVKACLDKADYQKGIQISDEQMAALDLRPHQVHPTWNYTFVPHTKP